MRYRLEKIDSPYTPAPTGVFWTLTTYTNARDSAPGELVAELLKAKARLDAMRDQWEAEAREEILARCAADPDFKRRVIEELVLAEADRLMRAPLPFLLLGDVGR